MTVEGKGKKEREVNREPSITKNDWPSTAEELIFQEAFNLPQDIS